MPTIEFLRTIMYVLAAFTCIVLVGSAICWRLKRTMMNIEQHSRDYTEKSEARSHKENLERLTKGSLYLGIAGSITTLSLLIAIRFAYN